jgi:hypothetical protein
MADTVTSVFGGHRRSDFPLARLRDKKRAGEQLGGVPGLITL